MDLNIAIYIGGVLKGSKIVSTPCLIGRSKEARLTVAHPAMSRKHCELYEEGEKLFLRDNSSLNGTLFKGDYVETPIELSFGDEFVVGELMFRVTAAEQISSDERQLIADKPTAVIESIGDDDSDDRPGVVTLIQPPMPKIEDQNDNKLPPDAKPEETPDKSGSKKISPSDVRINIK